MKRKYLILIIIMMFLVVGCGKKDNNNDNGSSNNTNGNISYVAVNEDYVLMLTNKGDLYAYGSYAGYASKEKITGSPKVIASNVKKVINNDISIYYIDSNNKLYYVGNGVQGGGTSSFEYVTDNVIDGSVQNNFCSLYVKSDGVYREGIFGDYCGWDSNYNSIEKINISNVKKVIAGNYYSGYIDNNNNLYLAGSKRLLQNNYTGESYNLFLTNVKDVSNNYVLTNNGEVYYIAKTYDESGNKFEAVKIGTNGQKLYDEVYLANNKLYYCYLCNQTRGKLYELKYTDVKEHYYGKSDSKLVYLNNNNKIVLASDVDNSILDLSTNSMKKIYDFLQTK